MLANINSALVSTACWREWMHIVYTAPMSFKCWPESVLAIIHSALVSTSCWRECVHIVYNAPMLFKCWPASYTKARHWTKACYADTLLGEWWACVFSLFIFSLFIFILFSFRPIHIYLKTDTKTYTHYIIIIIYTTLVVLR